MPVYNGAKWIATALEALTTQTYRNFRLVISDNASTDNTWELLKLWAARDERIVLFRQEENIGPMRNFRYVLDRSETELFIWHAHDDWWAPNYLEALVTVISENPESDVACSKTVSCFPDGSAKKEIRFPALKNGRLRRVAQLLAHPEATWIYGLYRAGALSRAQAIAEEFAHIWTLDRVAILIFIVNDRIAGTNDTTFFQRTAELSSDRYRPTAAGEQIRFLSRFARFHVRILASSRLRVLEKILLGPWLLVHLARSAHLRNYKRFIKWPLQRLIARCRRREWRDPREGRGEASGR